MKLSEGSQFTILYFWVYLTFLYETFVKKECILEIFSYQYIEHGTTALYSTVGVYHHLVNLPLSDRHLGYSKSYVITNNAELIAVST